jgi:hypothetical protein
LSYDHFCGGGGALPHPRDVTSDRQQQKVRL